MNEKNTLNILNGQSMYDYIKKNHFDEDGFYVPFNEAMCVGKATSDIFSSQFNKLRCEAHKVTLQQYKEHTLLPLQPLFKHQFSDIVLWFDDDMFCQINLLTILAYLNQINYSKKITFNLIGQKYKVINRIEINVPGYHDLYNEVMINRSIPQNIDLLLMENGIRLYFEYLNEDNEITEYIKQNKYLEINNLVIDLLGKFPKYGLGDTQYIQLIERYRISN